MKIAGQILYPQIRNAAMEMPVGAHTGDTLTLMKATLSPNLPVIK
jgi:hypothetical protein